MTAGTMGVMTSFEEEASEMWRTPEVQAYAASVIETAETTPRHKVQDHVAIEAADFGLGLGQEAVARTFEACAMAAKTYAALAASGDDAAWALQKLASRFEADAVAVRAERLPGQSRAE